MIVESSNNIKQKIIEFKKRRLKIIQRSFVIIPVFIVFVIQFVGIEIGLNPIFGIFIQIFGFLLLFFISQLYIKNKFIDIGLNLTKEQMKILKILHFNLMVAGILNFFIGISLFILAFNDNKSYLFIHYVLPIGIIPILYLIFIKIVEHYLYNKWIDAFLFENPN